MSYLDENETYLLIDSSQREVKVGILKNKKWLAFEEGTSALEAIFFLTEKCLQQTRLFLENLGGFLFCEGPGSNLGIRLASMAIRTWNLLPEIDLLPIFSFNNLRFFAESIRTNEKLSDFTVLSPSKMGCYNFLKFPNSESKIIEVGKPLLEQEENLFYFQEDPFLDALDNAKQSAYDLQQNASLFYAPYHIVRLVDRPELFITTEANYQKWKTTN